MAMRVLVAYASKHGATAAIAERIGQRMRDAGLAVDVLLADHAVELQRYGAVVLGSAVYAGHWRREAVSFIKTEVQTLSRRPVWIFSSGPTGEGDPIELVQGWRYPESLQRYIDEIQPRDIRLFHGDLNSETLSLAERLIVAAVKAPLGDFRDWDQIDAWAERIAAELQPSVETSEPTPQPVYLEPGPH